MTYVVTENCIQCKHTDCVEVCPVSCFHEGPNFVVIDPNECIDCNLCAQECPVSAIYSEDALPEQYQKYISINKRLSKVWPSISKKKSPLNNADKWSLVDDKLGELLESWN